MTHLLLWESTLVCTPCCPSAATARLASTLWEDAYKPQWLLSGVNGFHLCNSCSHELTHLSEAGFKKQCTVCWVCVSPLSMCLSRCPHPDCCRRRDDGGWFPWVLWCHPGVPVPFGNCELHSQLKGPCGVIDCIFINEKISVVFVLHSRKVARVPCDTVFPNVFTLLHSSMYRVVLRYATMFEQYQGQNPANEHGCKLIYTFYKHVFFGGL